jgi:hypothetical protein
MQPVFRPELDKKIVLNQIVMFIFLLDEYLMRMPPLDRAAGLTKGKR